MGRQALRQRLAALEDAEDVGDDAAELARAALRKP
jgi:hypothetical protein